MTIDVERILDLARDLHAARDSDENGPTCPADECVECQDDAAEALTTLARAGWRVVNPVESEAIRHLVKHGLDA